MTQIQADADRERLRQYFLTLSEDQQVKGWDVLWQQKLTPWDRNRPNPALVDTLVDKPELTALPWETVESGEKVRMKALVPGCGRGCDVVLFASYGFDAYGLDSSPTAIEAANELLRAPDTEQRFPVQNAEHGRGEAKFIETDFFSDGFLAKVGTTKSNGPFDLIYDYTFLCALPPSMRPKWAARMSELLAPGGTLICLEFPLGKDPKLGGPPHGLKHELYEQLFENPGREVADDSLGEKAENALVRVDTWKPKNCFEGQEQATMVSLWHHKKQ